LRTFVRFDPNGIQLVESSFLVDSERNSSLGVAFWQFDRNRSNPTPSHAGPSVRAATTTMLRGTQIIDTAVYWSLTECHSGSTRCRTNSHGPFHDQKIQSRACSWTGPECSKMGRREPPGVHITSTFHAHRVHAAVAGGWVGNNNGPSSGRASWKTRSSSEATPVLGLQDVHHRRRE